MAGKKTRSPNYPGLGLSEAIKKAETLFKKERRAHTLPKVAVTAWGYKTLSGTAMRVLAALRQYGLLEDVGENVRVSDAAVTILHGEGDERRAALKKAALTPRLFAELIEEFKDGLPSDDSIKSLLVTKKSFGPEAAEKFVVSFRDTLQVAELPEKGYIPPEEKDKGETGRPERGGTRKVEQTKWNKVFTWPLSDGTTAELVLSGVRPGKEEIELLSDYFGLAKKALMKIATGQATSGAEAEEES